MSGGSVTVLAPNGRRQTVKYSPNTTILQVLEEVCRKQKLNCDEYDLKHHRTVLDTTVTLRFSGLPNNALLEMVPATRARLECDITLAVNLEDGTRVMGNFIPDDTLLNVLNQLCPQSLNHETAPVVIYTRREIYGSELQTCTLRSLGLTGGRAMVRVLHKSPEELKTQAAVAGILPSKPVEEKPYHRTIKPEWSQPKTETGNDKVDEPCKLTSEKSEEVDKDEIKPEKRQRHAGTDILKLAREKRKSIEVPSPKVEKKLNITGSIVQESANVKHGCKLLEERPMDIDNTTEYKLDCSKINEKPIEEEFIFLGSRNAMLFSLESAQALPSDDLPDDFFELTIDDARKILRDVKKQSQGTENAPLLTSALRNLEESKKQLRQLNKYKKAIIRVQFVDRIVLQGVFSPTDTIRNVMDFVREFLEDSTCKFYLYSTPPKFILDEDKRLVELGFVPNALIHFGTDNSEGNAGSSLKKKLQNNFTSNSTASLLASRIRSENMRNCPIEQENDQDMEVDYVPVAIAGPSTSSTPSYERKVVKSTESAPKWFKR